MINRDHDYPAFGIFLGQIINKSKHLYTFNQLPPFSQFLVCEIPDNMKLNIIDLFKNMNIYMFEKVINSFIVRVIIQVTNK